MQDALGNYLFVFFRLDVDLAIQNGKPTLFRRDAVLVHSILCDSVISSDHPWMPPAMLGLFSFSGLLNEVERMQVLMLDPLDYTESLLSLLYRLVDVSPLWQAFTKPEKLYGQVHMSFRCTYFGLPELVACKTARQLTGASPYLVLQLLFPPRKLGSTGIVVGR